MVWICDLFGLLPWNLNDSILFWLLFFLVFSQIPSRLIMVEVRLRREHPSTHEALGSLIKYAIPIPTIWRLLRKSYRRGMDPIGEAYVDALRSRLLLAYPLETLASIIFGFRLFCWGVDSGYV